MTNKSLKRVLGKCHSQFDWGLNCESFLELIQLGVDFIFSTLAHPSFFHLLHHQSTEPKSCIKRKIFSLFVSTWKMREPIQAVISYCLSVCLSPSLSLTLSLTLSLSLSLSLAISLSLTLSLSLSLSLLSLSFYHSRLHYLFPSPSLSLCLSLSLFLTHSLLPSCLFLSQ